MIAYYNENDPKAVAALRELIREGIIAPGDVDDRSIEDVNPTELLGYTQCHFFAGAGIWSYAARRAGWPDNRPLWTGSCPCQPFSAAGKGDGFADERHLWPAFFHLIQHGKPDDVPILGEQVASKDGLTWLDLVQADLEGANHSCWPFDLCAAGFGAPIIRQRLFWVACSKSGRRRAGLCDSGPAGVGRDLIADGRSTSGMERSFQSGLEGHCGDGDGSDEPGRVESNAIGSVAETSAVSRMGSTQSGGCGIGGDETRQGMRGHPDCAIDATGRLAGTMRERCEGERLYVLAGEPRNSSVEVGRSSKASRSGPTNGYWRDVDWLYCRDDRWRPVEPGAFVLAHGYPERTGLLRLAGNAINAEVATAFIEEVMAVL